MQEKIWMLAASLSGAMAVAIGAFHAHGLQEFLQRTVREPTEVARSMEHVATAIRYQMTHATALLAIGIFLRIVPQARLARVAGLAFVVGMLFFCGSLYGLALGGPPFLAHVAPIGGTAFILGWVFVAFIGPHGTKSPAALD